MSVSYRTEVSFWAVPEDGAELVSVSIVDSLGRPVAYTRGGGTYINRFTFTMPEIPVTITPVFANENVVTFDENGCLTNGTYFHLECEGSNPVGCSLSQKIVENPNEEVTDFKCFYSTSENTKGVVNKFKELGATKLALESDLNLGGYVDGHCAMSAFAPFDMTNLYVTEKEFNGNNHTIKGLCYEGDAQHMGFVLEASVYNVTFDSAHIVANNATNGSQAGVVAWYGDNLTKNISNVHVKNSYVSGTQAGAFVGSSAINNGVLVIQNAHVTGTEVHGLPSTGQGVTVSVAGGLVGFAHNLEITSAYLTNVNVTGGAKMGGVVGYIDATAYDIESPSKAEFYSVMFNGSVGKSCSENSSIGGLVGEYDNPSVYAKLTIKHSMVLPTNAEPVVYEEACSGVTLQNANVGGIVGAFSDGSIQMEMSIQNIATIGDISVSDAATSSVGYIAGAISVGAERTSANVYYNYHYGNDAVALGVGNFDYHGSGNELNTIDNWKKGYNVNYCYFSENVRNGNAKNALETDGPIGPHEYLVYQAEGYFRYMFKLKVDENGVFSSIVANGVASDEDMKSGKFAAALNNSSGAGEWTWSEDLNDGLPSIIGLFMGRPVYYLYLSIYDYGTDGTGLYLPTLNAAKLETLGLDTISWGVDHSNNVIFLQYGIAGYTDAEGHANAEFLKHYQDIVNDIAATNTVSYSLVGETVNGEYLSRISPITDTTVFTGQSRFTISIREKRAYAVEYVYCVVGVDGPDNCSLVDEAEQTIVFLSPRVDSYDNSNDYALVPSAVALGTMNDDLETRILGMTDDNVQVRSYDYSTDFVLFGDVIAKFSQSSDFSEITKIVVMYYTGATHQKAAVKNPTGAEFQFDVTAYNATTGVLQTVETSPVVSETEVITVPYGVTFAASGFFDNRVGYKYDSYSLMYKVENGYYRIDYSTYNPCRTIYAVDTLEMEDKKFPSYEQLYQGVGECVSKTFVISGLGEDDAIDLQEVKRAKSYFSQYMTDTFSVVPKYNPVEYTVTFDTIGWQHIYGTAVDDPEFVPGTAKYEMYIAKDFNSPATYNLDLENKKLPVFHAVTQELDNSSTGFNAYVGYWTYDSQKKNCELGASGESYECIDIPEDGVNALGSFSESLITDVTEAGKMDGADMNRSFTVYPVWSGASDERNFVIVDCEDSRDYDCMELPLSLELSQTFTMNGQQYTLKHQAEKSFMGDATIPIPNGRSSEYEFDVNVSAKPGFEVDLGGVYFESDLSQMNRYFSYDAEKKKLYVDGRANNSFNILMKNSGYSLTDYTVNLDLSGLDDDKYVVFGDGFAFQQTMNVGENGRIMHAYLIAGDDYVPVFWGKEADPETSHDLDWYKANAFGTFSSELISNVLGEDSDDRSMTLHALDVSEVPQYWRYFPNYYHSLVYVTPYPNELHGQIYLVQTVGGKTYRQPAHEVSYATSSEFGFSMPDNDIGDTITFQVVLEPEPGYVMEIESYGFNGNPSIQEEGVLGMNAEKTQYRYCSLYMGFDRINLKSWVGHYNINFTMTETENGKDVYVPNKYADGNYEMIQYEGLRDVTFETVQTPKLLDGEGCQVGWKVKGREVEERNTPNVVYEMPFMKAMAGDDDATTNILVPDGEFRFCNDDLEYHTLRLVVEGEGTLQLVQKVGKDPVNEGDPEPVYVHHAFNTDDSVAYLKIPVARDGGLEVGVKLMPVAIPDTGYALKEISYNVFADGNELTVMIEDSTSINIMQDQVWHVKFVPYKPVLIAYDLSLGTADSSNVWIPADAVDEGSIALGEDESATEMWKPYRSDSCFVGWSKNPASSRGEVDIIYTELNKSNYTDFSNDGLNKLYAVWTPYGRYCTRPDAVSSLNLGYFRDGNPNAMVLMGHTDTLVVTQKFGNTLFTHRADGFSDAVAYNPAGYDISVRIEPGMGYALDADDSEMFAYAVQRSSDGAQVVPLESADGVYHVGNLMASQSYYFGQNERELSYTFAYNVNADGMRVFYEDGWKDIDTLYPDESVDFPKGVLRTDARLLGWTLSRNSTKYYTACDTTFMSDLHRYQGLGMPTDTLYAVWNTYGLFENVTVTSASDKNGSFVISQMVNGVETEPIEVTAAGIQIPYSEKGLAFNVSFGAKTGYYLNAEDAISSVDAKGTTLGRTSNGGSLVFKSEKQVSLNASVGASLYKIAYNVNGADANVFYGDNWSSTDEKSLNDSSVAFPKNIYRSDACLVGWSVSASADSGSQELTSEFIETLDSAKPVDTLYAVWNECDVETYKVTFANTNVGSLVLTQEVENSTVSFNVSDTGLVVPVVEGGLHFKAAYTLKPGYSTDGDTLYVVDDLSGLMTTLANNSLTVEDDVIIALPTEGESYLLVFDANREGTVFYGPDFVTRKVYRLSDSTTSIPLPVYVYTSDRCMVGWSLDKSGGETYMQFTSELAEILQEFKPGSESYTLYAVWGEGHDCDEAYDRITVAGKNGYVRLAETFSGEENAVLHDFVNDGTMLLPKTMNGNRLRVVSVPDSSYVLDSLVMTRSGSDERQVFFEGAGLVFNLNDASFEAFFGKANRTDPDFVDPEFVQTGNAVRFTFSTSMYEITRNVSARVRLETIDGEVVIKETIADSIVPPYSGMWERFPLDAGRYVLTVTIGDAKNSNDFVKVFDVTSEIASVASEDAWQMVSIGNLDKESFVWDGDAIFYWWDESSAMGDFWHYKEYDPEEEIVPTRGYWYSSIEGRPLLLKSRDEREIGKRVVWTLDYINTGWNLVANPYGFALNLFADHPAEKVEETEESNVTFWRWNPDIANYVPTDVVKPYEAVWVKVTNATEWTVPVVPEFAADKPEEKGKSIDKRGRLAKAVGKNEWRVQMVLADAKGHRDSWNMLGTSSRPFAADEPPEGMGDHVNLSIVEGNRVLAKSVKAPAEEQEWAICLNASSERVGYLSFEGVDDLNALGLKVFVTIDGATTEMHDGNSLKVALRSSVTKATVRVAKSAKVVADLRIGGLRFAQAGRSLNVSFDAGADLAGTRTIVDVLNMDGKVVASRSGRTLAGTNVFTLDTPRGGVYMLHIRAGSQMKARRILVK
ncbi:MAG: T9SS type A sorting domain-containing protein [Fibrobacter sp.]|nr:T9SS type A sorting domain-containing protein [Fibrobacter sp.]